MSNWISGFIAGLAAGWVIGILCMAWVAREYDRKQATMRKEKGERE